VATSLIAFTDGSGKNWESFQRTRNSTAYENMVVIPGEPAQPTFTALASSIVTTTGASHLIMLQADGTLYTRIKRIMVEQVVGATTATLAQLQIVRVSTAGTGGSAITARGLDAADSYGGTIATLPTVKGTEGNILLQKRLQLLTTAQVAATTVNPNSWEWQAMPNHGKKAITIGPTSTDGIVLKIVTGIATSTVDITLEFTTDTAP
jgi:hypothetical protein